MKPFKNLDSQVKLLIDRGLDIPDPQTARVKLHDFNYYRFTGYSRQFQANPKAGNNTYIQGSSFADVCDLIALDDAFRSHLNHALKAVELSLRARLAYALGDAMGGESFYLEPSAYMPIMPNMDSFIDSLLRDMERSKSPTIARYVEGNSYSRIPIWVAIEVLSFGKIAKMLQYLTDDAPARSVAASYSELWSGFQSTIHSLAVLRNVCAHHGQIWHRRLDIQCPIPRKQRPRGLEFDMQGPYPAIVALERYMKNLRPGEAWGDSMQKLMLRRQDYAEGIYKPSPR